MTDTPEPISDHAIESLRVLIAAGPLVDCTWEQGSVLNLAASFIARLDAAEAENERLREAVKCSLECRYARECDGCRQRNLAALAQPHD